jgi:hypothetical protein
MLVKPRLGLQKALIFVVRPDPEPEQIIAPAFGQGAVAAAYPH